MIRPRPTIHITADPFGLYTIHTVVHRHERADAWCGCGAKLSTYRPIGDESCWACQQGEPVDPDELHPQIPTSWQRNSKNPQRVDP